MSLPIAVLKEGKAVQFELNRIHAVQKYALIKAIEAIPECVLSFLQKRGQ